MNYYAEAIKILAKDNADWEKLVFEIAQRHPKAVVEAAYNGPAWHVRARELLGQGRKIGAIKYCRAETGIGLKEAKEAVEDFMRENNLGQE